MRRNVSLLIVGIVLFVTACGGNDPVISAATRPISLEQGKVLYEAHCAACHGIQGEGAENWQRPLADGALPPPPHTDEGHTWHHPDGQLYGMVAQGGMAANSRMPAFGETLTHDEIIEVLEYIKTFWSAETRAIQANLSENLPYPPAPE
jgi:mono/diheme cytochrome c family protein